MAKSPKRPSQFNCPSSVVREWPPNTGLGRPIGHAAGTRAGWSAESNRDVSDVQNTCTGNEFCSRICGVKEPRPDIHCDPKQVAAVYYEPAILREGPYFVRIRDERVGTDSRILTEIMVHYVPHEADGVLPVSLTNRVTNLVIRSRSFSCAPRLYPRTSAITTQSGLPGSLIRRSSRRSPLFAISRSTF